jgi:hypothetical protein
MYFNNRKNQLILEVGGRTETKGTDTADSAVGAEWQQAFGRHMILIFGGFAGQRHDTGKSYGLRSEIELKF